MNYSSDKELWLAFQKKDQEAFSIIFHRYHAHLHNYGKKLIGSTALDDEFVKDSLQDFFLYLYEHCQQLSALDKIKPYLFLAFRRFLLRQVEKDKSKRLKIDKFQNSFPQFHFSAEEIIVQQEVESFRKATFKETINQLPKRQREVIYLRYYANLPTAEVADILSLSYQGVVNTLYKAIKTLRKNPKLLHLVKYLSISFALWFS